MLRFLLGMCTVVAISLTPWNAIAQSSSHKLSPKKNILGFDLIFLENGEIIRGGFEYAINESSAAIFTAGVGLLDNPTVPQSYFEPIHEFTISPYPLAGFTIGKTGVLGVTPLSYFSYIGFGVTFVREIERSTIEVTIDSPEPIRSETIQEVKRTLSLGPSVNVGVFKPIEITPGFIAFPFFGLSYTYRWTAIGKSFSTEDFKGNTEWSNFAGLRDFAGTLGMEFELSPKFGVFGALDFSFNDSATITRIGVNFY